MKRFYKTVTTEQSGDVWHILLDGKAIRTPKKAMLAVPTEKLAVAVIAEWDAQVDKVVPAKMPFTRYVNSIIDHLSIHYETVIAEISAFGESDLICYRAQEPQDLSELQAAAWDPLLQWSHHHLKAPLLSVHSIMHKDQPESSLAILHELVAELSVWQLAPLHTLVSISGSLIIGLAVVHNHMNVDIAWTASRIDADYQIAKWGEDYEAQAVSALRLQDMQKAAEFLALL
jgi:chaperone required for assembly of F1-ATPase